MDSLEILPETDFLSLCLQTSGEVELAILKSCPLNFGATIIVRNFSQCSLGMSTYSFLLLMDIQTCPQINLVPQIDF